MAILNELFLSVLLVVFCASYSSAIVIPTAKHSTHRVRDLGNGLRAYSFHPASEYRTFGEGIATPASFSSASVEEKTVQFVASQLNIDAASVSFKSGFTQNGETHGYARQFHNEIPFVNAVANVAFKDNKAIAFGSSFVKTDSIADSKPIVDVKSIIPKVEEALQGKKNDIAPTLEYLALEGGKVALVHVFQVQNENVNSWYEAYVDAHTGELVSITDFVNNASYKVLPIWKETLAEGLETIVVPAFSASSPNGWHTGNDTQGNNVSAFKLLLTATSVQSADGLVFDYTYDPAAAPSDGQNIDAARTNAFYVVNAYHDTLYQYGFTESAFNFQNDNFGKGGVGNDRIRMSVQDRDGTNNANFATPPDGTPGLCLMYVWSYTTVRRDGSLENDIPIHEITHGTSNRLTGGGTGRCLQTTEAGGMGEGWSDAYADWFYHSESAEITDFVIGQYVTNNTAGIRSKPYSTSATTNPQRYSTVNKLYEVHDIGEVWANMLHILYADLVTAHGWSVTARSDSTGSEGNVVWMNIVTGGLSLQPCNPTFPAARDAIIQADQNKYGGAHKCLIWKTFASRGLGVGAARYVDSTIIPNDC